MKLHLEAESAPSTDTATDLDPFAAPSQPDTGNGKSPYPPLTMSLTINFSGEQEIDIPGARALGIPSGKATFGVRRCELRFTLSGCRLPLDQVTLSAPLQRSVTVETQREQATESQVGVTVGGTVGEKLSGTGSSTVGFKKGNKTVEKVTNERFQIHYAGGEDAPMWVFEVKDTDMILRGALTREPLGTLVCEFNHEQMKNYTVSESLEAGELGFFIPDATVVGLSVFVDVRPEDVRLTWGKYGWAQNITRTPLAAIEQAIARRHIAPKLKDGLSMAGWQYDGH